MTTLDIYSQKVYEEKIATLTTQIRAVEAERDGALTLQAAYEQVKAERDRWRDDYDRALSTRDVEIKIRRAAEAERDELQRLLRQVASHTPALTGDEETDTKAVGNAAFNTPFEDIPELISDRLADMEAELATLKQQRGLGERVLGLLTSGKSCFIDVFQGKVWAAEYNASEQPLGTNPTIVGATGPTPHAALQALCDAVEGERT